MSETKTVRDTVTLQADGRMTIPDEVRKAVNVYGQKAFLQVENYGKDKILITVLSRWSPTNRGPGKDVVKK